MTIVWILLVFVQPVVSNVLSSAFSREPQNAAFKLNDMGYHTVHCTANLTYWPVIWYASTYNFTKALTHQEKLYHARRIQGFKLNSFLVDNFPTMDLLVPQTNMDLAGNYTCYGWKNVQTRTAGLVILESDPVCTSNQRIDMLGGDVLTFSCEVVYKNYPHPQMRWTSNGYDIPDITDESIPGERTKTSLTMNVTVYHHGLIITVDTFFPAPPANSIWATNAPSYKHQHVFPPLTIKGGQTTTTTAPTTTTTTTTTTTAPTTTTTAPTTTTTAPTTTTTAPTTTPEEGSVGVVAPYLKIAGLGYGVNAGIAIVSISSVLVILIVILICMHMRSKPKMEDEVKLVGVPTGPRNRRIMVGRASMFSRSSLYTEAQPPVE